MKYKRRMGKDRMEKTPFVMCVRSTMLGYMQGLSEKMSFLDGVLVYSMWNGYRNGEKMKSFISGCEALGLEVVSLHTSGHADTEAIKSLIKATQPSEIIPIHTENPEWFSNL